MADDEETGKANTTTDVSEGDMEATPEEEKKEKTLWSKLVGDNDDEDKEGALNGTGPVIHEEVSTISSPPFSSPPFSSFPISLVDLDQWQFLRSSCVRAFFPLSLCPKSMKKSSKSLFFSFSYLSLRISGERRRALTTACSTTSTRRNSSRAQWPGSTTRSSQTRKRRRREKKR